MPKAIRGVVISHGMNKTRVIRTVRMSQHPFYGKSIRKSSKVFIHDEKNESKTGDQVLALACRPLSKNTHFRLIQILHKGTVE